jgi:RNA polymerase sigma-70 factor, ECF subfamily
MENASADHPLPAALGGDILAFQTLFAQFQRELRSYLYRLVADRSDAEDLTHDTFIRAYDRLATFKGTSSLKTWVFQIATNLAYDHLRRFRRWPTDAQEQCRTLAHTDRAVQQTFLTANLTSPHGAYEIREHVDFCFTCIGKSLPLDQQVALLLKDVYDFSVKEITLIMGQSEGIVKHALGDARRTMRTLFDNRCALINKNGVCHQCTELNGLFNPKQNHHAERLKLQLATASADASSAELLALRTVLVRGIDPLNAAGTDLHDALLAATRQAIGEVARG